MDQQDLQQYIDREKIAAEIVPLGHQTHTVADAADAVGVAPTQIIKSVLFTVNETPYLIIANGLARVDRRKVAALLDVGRRKIRLADAETVLATTGYPVGTVPPFGHTTPITTFIDRQVMAEETVYGGSGAVSALMRVEVVELARVVAGEVVDVVEGES